MAQQTAVEWLMTQLPLGLKITIAEKLEQAKQMEREQIKDAWDNAAIDASYGNKYKSFDHYYNETYGK